MASLRPRSVTEYLAALPRASRVPLTRVRRAIRQALPRAEEVISYGIPAYKLDGRIVVYFAGWRAHYSIYPFTARLADAFKDEIGSYELSHKGTIRFPLTGAVPVRLIARIAKARAEDVIGRGQKASGHQAREAGARRRSAGTRARKVTGVRKSR